ncbi:hypothetical protein BCR36DRAFT_306461, partial [Piromyces finnis]
MPSLTTESNDDKFNHSNKLKDEISNIINDIININISSDIDFELAKIVKSAVEKFKKDTERINILIAGKTGVGKKTLIDSIFYNKLGTLGNKKNITNEIQEISQEEIPLSIINIDGPEKRNYKQIISDLKKLINERQKNKIEREMIHIAWICIEDCTLWIEEEEEELIRMLHNYMPVIAIITKLSDCVHLQNSIR